MKFIQRHAYACVAGLSFSAAGWGLTDWQAYVAFVALFITVEWAKAERCPNWMGIAKWIPCKEVAQEDDTPDVSTDPICLKCPWAPEDGKVFKIIRD